MVQPLLSGFSTSRVCKDTTFLLQRTLITALCYEGHVYFSMNKQLSLPINAVGIVIVPLLLATIGKTFAVIISVAKWSQILSLSMSQIHSKANSKHQYFVGKDPRYPPFFFHSPKSHFLKKKTK